MCMDFDTTESSRSTRICTLVKLKAQVNMYGLCEAKSIHVHVYGWFYYMIMKDLKVNMCINLDIFGRSRSVCVYTLIYF